MHDDIKTKLVYLAREVEQYDAHLAVCDESNTEKRERLVHERNELVVKIARLRFAAKICDGDLTAITTKDPQ